MASRPASARRRLSRLQGVMAHPRVWRMERRMLRLPYMVVADQVSIEPSGTAALRYCGLEPLITYGAPCSLRADAGRLGEGAGQLGKLERLENVPPGDALSVPSAVGRFFARDAA